MAGAGSKLPESGSNTLVAEVRKTVELSSWLTARADPLFVTVKAAGGAGQTGFLPLIEKSPFRAVDACFELVEAHVAAETLLACFVLIAEQTMPHAVLTLSILVILLLPAPNTLILFAQSRSRSTFSTLIFTVADVTIIHAPFPSQEFSVVKLARFSSDASVIFVQASAHITPVTFVKIMTGKTVVTAGLTGSTWVVEEFLGAEGTLALVVGHEGSLASSACLFRGTGIARGAAGFDKGIIGEEKA